MNAGARLADRMARLGPVCAGIDPHPALLEAWGLPDSADGAREFALACVSELSGVAAAIKPQAALFEQYGSAGVAALEDCLAAARKGDHFAIVDAKRGDIGSTMAGYARAYLGVDSPLAGDAVTLSPYLGFGSLAPAIDAAVAAGKGVFVLALTSNPEGAQVQHAQRDGASVAGSVLAAAHAVNAAVLETDGGEVGPVGSVVGATIGHAPDRLGIDLASFNGIHLAPGVGAQGAGGEQIREVFGDARVLASVSRGLLAAGPGQLARAYAEVCALLGAQ